MTNINKKLTENLRRLQKLKLPEAAAEQRSADGTIKWAKQV